jgi:hypothetical protein
MVTRFDIERSESERKIKDLEEQNDILKKEVARWKARYYAIIRGDNGE